MKVQNMTGRTGREIPNQFLIYRDDGWLTFQSYKSVIARTHYDGRTELDKKYWDYSQTTGKYRNQFLGESKAETQAKIDSGEYILTDLNQPN